MCYHDGMSGGKIVKPDFSCGGVVWDDDRKKLLIVKVENLSKSVVWTFPKGHPEKGETDEQAAIREVQEETGWQCTVTGKLMDVEYYYTHNDVTFHKTVRWFRMEPVRQTGKPMEGEILECAWATADEAKKKITYDSDRKLLAHLGF